MNEAIASVLEQLEQSPEGKFPNLDNGFNERGEGGYEGEGKLDDHETGGQVKETDLELVAGRHGGGIENYRVVNAAPVTPERHFIENGELFEEKDGVVISITKEILKGGDADMIANHQLLLGQLQDNLNGPGFIEWKNSGEGSFKETVVHMDKDGTIRYGETIECIIPKEPVVKQEHDNDPEMVNNGESPIDTITVRQEDGVSQGSDYKVIDLNLYFGAADGVVEPSAVVLEDGAGVIEPVAAQHVERVRDRASEATSDIENQISAPAEPVAVITAGQNIEKAVSKEDTSETSVDTSADEGKDVSAAIDSNAEAISSPVIEPDKAAVKPQVIEKIISFAEELSSQSVEIAEPVAANIVNVDTGNIGQTVHAGPANAALEASRKVEEPKAPFSEIRSMERAVSPEADEAQTIVAENVESEGIEVLARINEKIEVRNTLIEAAASKNVDAISDALPIVDKKTEDISEMVLNQVAVIKPLTVDRAVSLAEEQPAESVAEIVDADADIKQAKQLESTDIPQEVLDKAEKSKIAFSEVQSAEKTAPQEMDGVQAIPVKRTEFENAEVPAPSIEKSATKNAAAETGADANADASLDVLTAAIDVPQEIRPETIAGTKAVIETQTVDSHISLSEELGSEPAIEKTSVSSVTEKENNDTAVKVTEHPVESAVDGNIKPDDNKNVDANLPEITVTGQKTHESYDSGANNIEPTMQPEPVDISLKVVGNMEKSQVVAEHPEITQPVFREKNQKGGPVREEKQTTPVIVDKSFEHVIEIAEAMPAGFAENKNMSVSSVNIREVRSESAIFTEEEVKADIGKTAVMQAENAHQSVEVARVDENKTEKPAIETIGKNVQAETAVKFVDKSAKAGVESNNQTIETAKHLPKKEAANESAIEPVEILHYEKIGTENSKKGEPVDFKERRSHEGRDFIWSLFGFDGAPRNAAESVKSAAGTALGGVAANDDQYSFGRNYGKVAEDAESGITMFRQRTNFKKTA